jgi:hypothetical protein
MTSTLAALLLAHVVADFLFQTKDMVAQKRKPQILLLHGVIVLITAQLALGRIDAWEPLALAAAHIVIDTIKVYALPDRLASFVTDQAAHVATILAVALYAPNLYASGIWASQTWIPAAMILAAGFIITTVAGGHAVAYLVSQWSDKMDNTESLPNAGRWIGLLERGIIFILILAGQPGGIGFLIAAKSVLRFDAERKKSITEYVIIGTLASFGWAMAATWGTLVLLETVPPLGISPRSP